MRKIIQLLIAGTVVIGSTLVAQSASAAPAGAAACGVQAPDKDRLSYGNYFEQSVYLRSGPEWGCDILDSATTSNLVDYHCYTYGDDGTWTYLRTKTSVYGWVWDDYLVEIDGVRGSREAC